MSQVSTISETSNELSRSKESSKDNEKSSEKEEATLLGLHKGYGYWVAAIFIVGETAGTGLVAIPNAVKNTGLYGGGALLVLVCLALGYTAHQLGENWILMRKRWPKRFATGSCRDPYPEMGRVSMGGSIRVGSSSHGASLLRMFLMPRTFGWGSGDGRTYDNDTCEMRAGKRINEVHMTYRSSGQHFTMIASVGIYMTIFGAAACLFLLAAKNLADLISLLDLELHFCILLVVVAVFVYPFIMLKSPANFWQVSIVAAFSTSLAVILIVVGISIDSPVCFPNSEYPALSVKSFSLGFGTIVFSYGGHPGFPTLQHDMKKPEHFSRAVLIAYTVMFCLYSPVSIAAYLIYGTSLTDSVIISIQTYPLRLFINSLITIHVIFSILIMLNPLLQGIEKVFDVKQEFGQGRVITRTVVYVGVIFAAATLPNFGFLLDLIGASTMTLLALVFPGLFSLFLRARISEEIENGTVVKDDQVQDGSFIIASVLRTTPVFDLVLNGTIIAVGVVFGIAATVNGVKQAVNSELAIPCYVRIWSEYNEVSKTSFVYNCCGAYKNITVFGDVCQIVE